MSTDTQSTIAYLNFVTRELNRYIPIIFLILGTIGNILNILVFTRPLVRKNPCSIYFVSGSISNFLSLYIGLITPFLGLYNLDPTQSIDCLCKLRFYLRFCTITLSTWFILLACIDRYLSTSINVNIRSWSSVHLAKRIVIIATLFCFTLPYTQVFYCYIVNQKNMCALQNITCKFLNDIILLICNSGLPPILMVLISILTIRNVKYSNRTVGGRRRDIQLIRILFIQVSILVLFAIPVAAQKIYSCVSDAVVKSALPTAIDGLISQIAIELSYISNSTTFYVYTFTSKKYRKEVLLVLSSLFPCCRKRNTIIPIELSRLKPNETCKTTNRNRIE